MAICAKLYAMKKSVPVIRTCLACGLEKPIAAFLQISGAQGTVYGNICSTCRGATARAKKIIGKGDEDEVGRGSSGVRIDAKTRLRTEVKQKKEEKLAVEIHEKGLEKRETADLKKTDLTEKKQKEELFHRKDYIETKKREGFLGTPPAEKPAQQRTPSFMSDMQKTLETKRNVEAAIEQEAKLTTVDTKQLYLDPQFAEIRFQSVIFKQFKESLGTSANFTTMERLYSKKAEQNIKQAKENKTEAKDPFVEFVERKGPSARK